MKINKETLLDPRVLAWGVIVLALLWSQMGGQEIDWHEFNDQDVAISGDLQAEFHLPDEDTGGSIDIQGLQILRQASGLQARIQADLINMEVEDTLDKRRGNVVFEGLDVVLEDNFVYAREFGKWSNSEGFSVDFSDEQGLTDYKFSPVLIEDFTETGAQEDLFLQFDLAAPMAQLFPRFSESELGQIFLNGVAIGYFVDEYAGMVYLDRENWWPRFWTQTLRVGGYATFFDLLDPSDERDRRPLVLSGTWCEIMAEIPDADISLESCQATIAPINSYLANSLTVRLEEDTEVLEVIGPLNALVRYSEGVLIEARFGSPFGTIRYADQTMVVDLALARALTGPLDLGVMLRGEIDFSSRASGHLSYSMNTSDGEVGKYDISIRKWKISRINGWMNYQISQEMANLISHLSYRPGDLEISWALDSAGGSIGFEFEYDHGRFSGDLQASEGAVAGVAEVDYRLTGLLYEDRVKLHLWDELTDGLEFLVDIRDSRQKVRVNIPGVVKMDTQMNGRVMDHELYMWDPDAPDVPSFAILGGGDIGRNVDLDFSIQNTINPQVPEAYHVTIDGTTNQHRDEWSWDLDLGAQSVVGDSARDIGILSLSGHLEKSDIEYQVPASYQVARYLDWDMGTTFAHIESQVLPELGVSGIPDPEGQLTEILVD